MSRTTLAGIPVRSTCLKHWRNQPFKVIGATADNHLHEPVAAFRTHLNAVDLRAVNMLCHFFAISLIHDGTLLARLGPEYGKRWPAKTA